jgi:fumarate reductase flavoprotein subunit
MSNKKFGRSILGVFLAASVILGCSSTKKNAPLRFNPGTYTSTQRGMGGEFDVTVTFGEDAIESINIGENKETYMVGTEALRILPERIIENQSLQLDVVSGASITSYAVIYGVRNCVEQAQGSLDALLAAPVIVDTYDNLPHKADITENPLNITVTRLFWLQAAGVITTT